MEGIKPTRVNDGADRRDGWRSGHGVTPTYHGELGYGQGEGGLGGRQVWMCYKQKRDRKQDSVHLQQRSEGDVPDCVTALICWRLAIERVFNQSV